MKEIYETLMKNVNPLLSPSESQDFWATFGIEVFKKYLKPEIEKDKEIQRLKIDFQVLTNFISPKEQKRVLKLLAPRYKDYFITSSKTI